MYQILEDILQREVNPSVCSLGPEFKSRPSPPYLSHVHTTGSVAVVASEDILQGEVSPSACSFRVQIPAESPIFVPCPHNRFGAAVASDLRQISHPFGQGKEVQNASWDCSGLVVRSRLRKRRDPGSESDSHEHPPCTGPIAR
ncbi:hypothetical protein AVEN_102650-1, partial [Araneus ventricosus]